MWQSVESFNQEKNQFNNYPRSYRKKEYIRKYLCHNFVYGYTEKKAVNLTKPFN